MCNCLIKYIINNSFNKKHFELHSKTIRNRRLGYIYLIEPFILIIFYELCNVVTSYSVTKYQSIEMKVFTINLLINVVV